MMRDHWTYRFLVSTKHGCEVNIKYNMCELNYIKLKELLIFDQQTNMSVNTYGNATRYMLLIVSVIPVWTF